MRNGNAAWTPEIHDERLPTVRARTRTKEYRGRAVRTGQSVVLLVRIRSRDVRRAAANAVCVGHHDGDERGQGVHVLADTAADVNHVAVQQAVAVRRHERAGPRHDRNGRGYTSSAVRLVLGRLAVHVRAHRVFRVHHVPLGHQFRVLHNDRIRHDLRLQRVVQGATVDVHVPDGHDPDGHPRHQRSADHGGRMADISWPVG